MGASTAVQLLTAVQPLTARSVPSEGERPVCKSIYLHEAGPGVAPAGSSEGDSAIAGGRRGDAVVATPAPSLFTV